MEGQSRVLAQWDVRRAKGKVGTSSRLRMERFGREEGGMDIDIDTVLEITVPPYGHSAAYDEH